MDNLEKLVSRLEAATVRLEALGSQKPALAPKPHNGTMPKCSFNVFASLAAPPHPLPPLHPLIPINVSGSIDRIVENRRNGFRAAHARHFLSNFF